MSKKEDIDEDVKKEKEAENNTLWKLLFILLAGALYMEHCRGVLS